MAFHLVLLTALVSFGCERGALADANMRASGSSWGGAEAGPTFLDLSKDASSGREVPPDPVPSAGGACSEGE
eukprot:CAMPEP_0177181934 /NCGR_PEP_ID=MMETSP0367-20130122/16195_1 /TAXON_ID=447022 ORGANISM="Scrippsiella hangoei-like, Strain SHHI-4" /NCGR_SAMPLE_ID=MMETSP0367 /ASSEMBLY_ACC=CAM_ASM_000362 /LENGTH=71 /DNA_ID=CAMNT_0018628829 /DNA_START=65 /DNA_END=280 /DNA_ORIENTATION=+